MLGLSERRRQELVNELSVLMKRPRTRTNKAQIDSLIDEDNDLQSGVDREREQRAAQSFYGYLRGRGYDKNLLTPAPRAEIRLGEAGLATGTASAGGVLVPLLAAAKVYEAMKLVGPMLDDSVVSILDTPTGATLNVPELNDTSVAAVLINENAQAALADIPQLGQRLYGAYKYHSNVVPVTTELLQDSTFPIDSLLSRAFGVRLARGGNTALTTGTGTGMPLGIVTAALAESNATVLAVGSVGDDGTGGFNTIGTSDLANLEAAVDAVYRASEKCCWMMHANTLKALRMQKDRQGRFSFLGLHDSQPEDQIFGYRVVVNNNMDQLQTIASSPAVTRSTVLFGDFGQWTTRRTPLMVYTLNERFAEFGVVAFFATQRYDGGLLDQGGGAVRVLQNVG